jgi:hypothetical protein
MSYLSSWLLACYLFVMIHSYLSSIGTMVEYSCLNTCLYTLWSTLIFYLMHSISFFPPIVFDKFIAKGGEIVHKVGWTLANRVVERRNMIMSIKGGELTLRVLGELFQWEFWAFLGYSFQFCLVYHFLCHLLALQFFLPLDDLLKLFFDFWSSSCASCGLDSKFKLCAFVLSMYSSSERLGNQVVRTLVLCVMSH